MQTLYRRRLSLALSNAIEASSAGDRITLHATRQDGWLEIRVEDAGPGIPRELRPAAMARLVNYHYPGNVRQLRNIMERLVVLSNHSVIEEKDLPGEVRFYDPTTDTDLSGRDFESLLRMRFKDARPAFETRYLLGRLKENQDNISRTAESISLRRQSLQQKIKTLGLKHVMG